MLVSCGAGKGFILDLQPIPGDPKDNGVAAMLDDRTFCFVIQNGRHAIVFFLLEFFRDSVFCSSVWNGLSTGVSSFLS